ncbi:DMT family transporter [Lacticaseibacillus songhuajiangensis]|jgi:quaternary ammonium compound-resistance protein SugE|uniref:DMT family transporter n=1 Tax=Lacticaseibacillus songhuajiangensis TaxID=1296539 RepID=UPI000F772BBF|nr:multidrug efflux SMR transporter [Lacticaseibacillus songhuajiangensis]MCI1283442.1 multidrug efflux SMR transporter [Lacticaseibacillus songhuajiangensis]
MAWLYLTLAGLLEVVWATFMKLSDGFHKLGFAALTVLGMVLSFVFLAEATRRLPMSIAYPVWTGIGAVGSVLVGVILFGDRISPLTWVFVGFLFVGIVGIKLTSH